MGQLVVTMCQSEFGRDEDFFESKLTLSELPCCPMRPWSNDCLLASLMAFGHGKELLEELAKSNE